MSKIKNWKQNQENKEQMQKKKIKQPKWEVKQKQSKKRKNFSFILYLLISNIYLLLLFLQKALFYPKPISKFRPSPGINAFSSLLFSSLLFSSLLYIMIKE